MALTLDLTGKVAIVTGSSRGLGRAMAAALAEAGADLVVTSRHPESLKPVCEQLASFGRRVFGPQKADLDGATTVGKLSSSSIFLKGSGGAIVGFP